MKKILIISIIVLIMLIFSGCIDRNTVKKYGDDLDTDYMPNEEIYFYVDNTLGGGDFDAYLIENNTVINKIHGNESGRYVFNPRPKPGRYTLSITNDGWLGIVEKSVLINIW